MYQVRIDTKITRMQASSWIVQWVEHVKTTFRKV